MKEPWFLSPNPPQFYLASEKSACHGKAEQLAKILRKFNMKPIPEKLRLIPVSLQAGIYLLCVSTGKPRDISEHHHPEASPQHPPQIAFPHSPQTGWESSRERAGRALQSSPHISPWGQSLSRGSWPPTLGSSPGSAARGHLRPQMSAFTAQVSRITGPPVQHTEHTYSSYSLAVCAEIILAGSGS